MVEELLALPLFFIAFDNFYGTSTFFKLYTWSKEQVINLKTEAV